MSGFLIHCVLKCTFKFLCILIYLCNKRQKQSLAWWLSCNLIGFKKNKHIFYFDFRLHIFFWPQSQHGLRIFFSIFFFRQFKYILFSHFYLDFPFLIWLFCPFYIWNFKSLLVLDFYFLLFLFYWFIFY